MTRGCTCYTGNLLIQGLEDIIEKRYAQTGRISMLQSRC